jgi:hypothetical protein
MASLQLTSTGEPETGPEDHPSGVETTSAPSSPSPSPPSPSPSGSLPQEAACQHPPSSQDSPSIVISQFDSSHATRHSEPRGSKSLGRSNRFAPYLGAASNVCRPSSFLRAQTLTMSQIQLRRSSLPDAPAELPQPDVPERVRASMPDVTRPPKLTALLLGRLRPHHLACGPTPCGT